MEWLRSVVESGRSAGSDSATQAGSLLGTPAYMPPEQARGEVERTDRRSDVFALGAILCEVLTGRPPYVGTLKEMQALALVGHQTGALERLDGCGADAELVALTKRCLGPQPEDRPADAAAVAEAIAAYRAGVEGRLRQAEVEAAATAARAAEERKRRRFQVVTAFAVVLAAGGVGWLWERQASARREEKLRQETEAREEQSRREALTREAVEAALVQAEDGLRRERLEVTDAALAQAERRLTESGSEDLRERLARVQKDLTMVRELDRILERRWTIVEGKYDAQSARKQYPVAFRGYGLAVGEAPAQALAETIRASTIGARLIDGLDVWCSVDRLPAIVEVLAEADPDADRGTVRKALQSDRLFDTRLFERCLANDSLPSGFVACVYDSGKLSTDDSIRLLRSVQARHPDRFVFALLLARKLSDLGAGLDQEAVGYCRAALALRPDSVAAYNCMGVALNHKGDNAAAVVCYRKAIELDPKFSWPHTNLGIALSAMGDLDVAISCCRKAIELDPKYSGAHNSLGFALEKKGDRAGAIACYRKAIELDPNYSLAHNNLGGTLYGKGDVAGAVACFRKAIDADPKNAQAHNNLGIALNSKGDVEGAIACYRKAVEADPKFAFAHDNLGVALAKKGDADGAIACYRKAIELDPKYALAQRHLGVALWAKKDVDGSAAALRTATELDPKDALARRNLGIALNSKGDVEGAVACYRKAVELDPKDAVAHFNLGIALKEKGDVKGAVACYRKAIEWDPKSSSAHNNLGVALEDKGDVAGAAACYRKAVELDPKNAQAHNNLGVALKGKGDVAGAIACYRKAIEADPKFALAHRNLGVALWTKNDVDGSAAALRTAVELDPKDATARNNLGVALNGKGDRDGAIGCYRKAIELSPTFALPHKNLGDVFYATDRFNDSRDQYRKWLELVRKTETGRSGVEQRVRDAGQLAALQTRLPDLLAARATPSDAAQALALCRYCEANKRYAAQVRFAEAAFKDDPATADDRATSQRYDAACAACLTAAGQGVDPPPEADRPRFRRKSIAWLQEELTAWRKLLAEGPDRERTTVASKMKHWQGDADFASVRGPDALAKLPAEERAEWESLWRDVEALRVKAQSPPKAP